MFLGQIRPLHCSILGSILALTSVLVILLFGRCRSWVAEESSPR
jgi:hypothetical protein